MPFLLLTVPGSPVRLADAELCACLWVLCAVAVLTCAPAMTNSGALQGADWSFHLSRIEGIAQGLREGQFPVRVYSIAKDGYGYAPSLFYGELLLYFPAVLRLLGMSVQGAYHTYLLALQLLTAGIAFFSLRQISGITRRPWWAASCICCLPIICIRFTGSARWGSTQPWRFCR